MLAAAVLFWCSPDPTPPMTYDRMALMVGKSLAAMVAAGLKIVLEGDG